MGEIDSRCMENCTRVTWIRRQEKLLRCKDGETLEEIPSACQKASLLGGI